ncbi:cation-transporting P-type ATPase [Streptomyces naganishii]|uniref:Cation-transporting P-type ATPase N-terminal domain-containing protein n=2 Tax=Streptomyces naganishii TaxID=285447 RepID=A0A919CWE4_9ACTN|nr:cation-transporting P-type ATPase [Streptomyces naganishii]GHD91856.1 hypothetical protein GCM10010508_42280 [Streptomyces naganishii JCM 4654]
MKVLRPTRQGDERGPATGRPGTPASPSSGRVSRQPLHAQAVTDVFGTLESSPRGLSAATARTRLQAGGPNELPAARCPAVWRRLAGQFADLFAVVLMVASAITFIAYALQQPRDTGTLQLAVAILCVVVLNAVIGFAQEYSAERTAQTLQAMVPHQCRVVRDAVVLELPVRCPGHGRGRRPGRRPPCP